MHLAARLAHERLVADILASEAIDLLAAGRLAVMHVELVGLQRADVDRHDDTRDQGHDGVGTTCLLVHGCFSCLILFGRMPEEQLNQFLLAEAI